MDEALNSLGTTIGTMTQKIVTSKEAAAQYKSMIMAKLSELQDNIDKLKREAATNPQVLRLRDELQKSQDALASKTSELETSNAKLNELNAKITGLTDEIRSKDNDINATNAELDNLKRQKEEDRQQNIRNTNAAADLQEENRGLKENNNQHDAAFSELNAQLGVLKTEKIVLEQQLDSSRQQLENFVTRIGEINARLAGEIEKINTILKGFDEGDNVIQQIEAIGTNLAGIIQIINNQEQPRGGRRKTKKHKKMRGGYLYSKKSNSNSSSMLRSKSRSHSNSNSKSKSRRKKRLLNF